MNENYEGSSGKALIVPNDDLWPTLPTPAPRILTADVARNLGLSSSEVLDIARDHADALDLQQENGRYTIASRFVPTLMALIATKGSEMDATAVILMDRVRVVRWEADRLQGEINKAEIEVRELKKENAETRAKLEASQTQHAADAVELAKAAIEKPAFQPVIVGQPTPTPSVVFMPSTVKNETQQGKTQNGDIVGKGVVVPAYLHPFLLFLLGLCTGAAGCFLVVRYVEDTRLEAAGLASQQVAEADKLSESQKKTNQAEVNAAEEKMTAATKALGAAEALEKAASSNATDLGGQLKAWKDKYEKLTDLNKNLTESNSTLKREGKRLEQDIARKDLRITQLNEQLKNKPKAATPILEKATTPIPESASEKKP